MGSRYSGSAPGAVTVRPTVCFVCRMPRFDWLRRCCLLLCVCWQCRHGPGTLMLANGDLYEGHWEDDAKHGSGTFFYMAKGCRWVLVTLAQLRQMTDCPFH